MRYILFFIHMAVCHSEVIEIPDEIHKFCPYTDFCNKTAVETFDKMHSGKVKQPCCAHCSCDDKCGLRMDCCFADMDKFKLLEKGRAACLRPVDGVIGDDFMLNHYYYMVQSCGIEHLNSGSHSICDKDCLHDENGRQIIAPVVSLQSGFIYVNAECAECNDVFKYKMWNFYSVTNSVNFKNVANSSTTETKIFLPPDNIFGMNKNFCFKDFLTDECLENDTRLHLCRTLNAPFQYENSYYKNVFCLACRRTVDTLTCFKPLSGNINTLFTYLLDSTVTQMAKKASLILQTVESLYNGDKCNKSVICHDILCPEGMVNTPDGCKYYVIEWNVALITVQLKLHPVKEAELSEEMLSLNILRLSDPMSLIHIPCSNMTFSEVMVYNEISENKSKPINSFIIQLRQRKIDWLVLPETISSLRTCIDKQWSITVSNSRYALNASFDKYQSYIQDGQQRRKIIMHMDNETGNQEEEVRPKMFNLILKHGYVPRKSLSSLAIGKLFFCRNVELSTTEVSLDYGEIRILSNNVTLGDNEFMVKSNVGADGKSYNVVKVCVEDFIHDLHRIYDVNRGSDNMFGGIVLVIVLQTAIYYYKLQD